VNNLKWGIAGAVAAAIISTGIGLLSGVNILHVFLRAVIFASLFFGFGFGLRFIVSSFFPELLFLNDEPSAQESFDQPGSRINITLDNTGEYAVPELYKAPGDPQELGNIEDLISGSFRPRSTYDDEQPKPGIDRKGEESYNIDSVEEIIPEQDDFDFPDTSAYDKPQAEKPRVEAPAFTPSFGDDTGLGGLPDLELLSMAFSAGGGEPRAAPQPMAAPAGGGSFGVGGSVSVSAPEPLPDEFEPITPTRYMASKPTPMKGDFNPKELAQGISTVLRKDK